MEIVMRKVSELTPYGKNAKTHDEKQVANVANSIKRFGWQQPIVIDENGVVVIGHCRLMAAKKLKLQEVPVTVASGLTDDEIKELRIADNKTNESPWDLNLLAEDIEGLDFEGFDLNFGIDGELGGGVTANGITPDMFSDEFALPDGGKPEICQMTFTLHAEQKALIEYAISIVKECPTETFGNTNACGNGLYEVVRQWAEQRK